MYAKNKARLTKIVRPTRYNLYVENKIVSQELTLSEKHGSGRRKVNVIRGNGTCTLFAGISNRENKDPRN